MHTNGLAYIDEEYVPIAEAKIPLLDWGFLRSDACQDTVSVHRGRFFKLRDHLRRFRSSCDKLRMTLPFGDKQLETVLGELVARSGLESAYVQMVMTRGVPAPGSRDIRTCRNRFLAFCIPYVWIMPRDNAGMKLHVSSRPRIPASSVPSEIKNYHWLDFELALFDAYDRGSDSVVLSDEGGMITEGPGFNLFVVRQGKLSTPPTNVLAGITRATVIELAGEQGIPCDIRQVHCTELADADEVFATSTAGGIMPVIEIDGRAIGSGAGPITDTLRTIYWNRRESGWHGSEVHAHALS